MPQIEIKTIIKGDIQDIFDLARNIDFHQQSTKQTKEKAIAGVTKGCIGLHEQVTWKAKHFGIYFTMTNKIMVLERPSYFKDVSIEGPFKTFEHDHYFEQVQDYVHMTDVLYFSSPFGILGKLVDELIMKHYLKRFLLERNKHFER